MVAEITPAVPEPVRDGIHNALSNLNSPVVLANDVLFESYAGEYVLGSVYGATMGGTVALSMSNTVLYTPAAVIVSNEAVRARLASGVHAVTERIGGLLSGDVEGLDIDHDEVVAFDAAETRPIEAAPFSESSAIDATGYPDGLGIDHDAAPVLEEATSSHE